MIVSEKIIRGAMIEELLGDATKERNSNPPRQP
jgi:hypothetical protein